MRKKEIVIFSAVFFLALAAWIGMSAARSRMEFGSIRITVDGEIFGVYSLGEDQVIDIGTGNVCRIENGRVKMTEADCPDHLCMRQPAVDEKGGSIICLPHKVVIEGIAPEGAAGEKDRTDAVG